MLTPQETELLTKLASAIGTSSDFIIAQYTGWKVVNATGWVIFGALLSASTALLKFDKYSDVAPWGQWLIRILITCVGAVFVFYNIANITNPKAAAIHQIISDIRGQGSRGV